MSNELIFKLDDTTLTDLANNATPTIQGTPAVRRCNEYHALKFTQSTAASYDCLIYENTDGRYDLSSKDWTVEWWEYRYSTNTIREGVISFNSTRNSNGGFVIGSPQNNKLRFFSNSKTGSSWDNGIVSDIGTVALKQWVHRALAFESSTKKWTAFENGKLYKSGTISSNIFDATGELSVGGRYCTGSSYYGSMGGYICGLKIWNGLKYTATFDIPKFPLVKDISVKLWMSGDSDTVCDNTDYNHTITVTDVELSTEHTRNDHKHSFYFNGTSSKILIDYDSELDLTGDLTIEWYEYCTTDKNGSRISTQYTTETTGTNGDGLLLGYQGTQFWASSTTKAMNNTTDWDICSGVTIFNNIKDKWVHRKIVKTGSSYYIYENKNLIWSGTNKADLQPNTTYPIAIGSYRAGDTDYFTGWIDDVKIYTHAIVPKAHYYAGQVINFDYTGAVQTATLPKGKYKLECWGAQGGGIQNNSNLDSSNGGLGGYSVGTLSLTQSASIYIYVGGMGKSIGSGLAQGGFNGGGCAYGSSNSEPGNGGGGATDIRISQDSLYSRVIVAGGGGGAGEDSGDSPGYGGGTSGGTSSGHSTAATQTSTGTGGVFGYGAHTAYDGGGGGGGWYGGGTNGGSQTKPTSNDGNDTSGGCGGSGYVYTSSTAKNYPSGCLLNSSYYLSDAKTVAGNTSFKAPSGSSETGHTKNGYCRITVIECSNETALYGKLNGSMKKATGFYFKLNNKMYDISKFSTVDIMDFNYTGSVQSVTLKAGSYQLECWGAQGGYRSSSSYGGKGGYSTGTLTLASTTTLYIYVGGSGNSVKSATNSIYPGGFNGGGRRYNYKGGGGATDIRIGTDSLYARAIVAGGGGSDGATNKTGMYGGGTTGGSSSESYGSGGYGGTQTGNSWSTSKQSTSATSSSDCYAGFGFGGNGCYYSSGYAGAGGGGWYGGSGSYPDGSGDDDRGGGGGSGYVYTSSTASNYPSGCRLNSSYYLSDAKTVAGNTSFTSPTGTKETGHSGNGFCRITNLNPKQYGIYVKKNGTWTHIDL